MSIDSRDIKKTIKPKALDEIRDKTKPTKDRTATNIKSFGKIVLKKGAAFAELKTLKTDGAIIAVWKSITPEIKPERKICKLINMFVFYII